MRMYRMSAVRRQNAMSVAKRMNMRKLKVSTCTVMSSLRSGSVNASTSTSPRMERYTAASLSRSVELTYTCPGGCSLRAPHIQAGQLRPVVGLLRSDTDHIPVTAFASASLP